MRFDAMSAVTGPYATAILESRLGAPAGTVMNGRRCPISAVTTPIPISSTLGTCSIVDVGPERVPTCAQPPMAMATAT